MTVIAHISDLHFGAEDPRIVDGLRAELNADPPDMVAISGDLTQGARLSEFRAARAFIDSLTAPVLAAPGNHDITPYNLAERFFDPYRRWREAISPDTEPQWRNDQIAVLGFNTAHRANLHWDWSRGRFSKLRLQNLMDRLAAIPESMIRVVVAHHPTMPPEDAPRAVIAGGAREALAAFARARVRLVLSGHAHRGYARFSHDGGDAPLILQSATTTSVRLRGEPNAYNRISFGEDARLAVEVRRWDGAGWSATI